MSSNPTLSLWAERIIQFIRTCCAHDSCADGQFNALALELFAFQFAEVPVYRQFCQRQGLTPDRVSSWSEIPAVPASAFKEFELSCLPPETRTRVFLSSGTSAQRRSRHFHDERSLRVYEASLLPWFQTHLLPEPAWPAATAHLAFVALTPPAEAAPTSSLLHMLQTVQERLPFVRATYLGNADAQGAWTLDLPRATECLKACVIEHQPVLLLGTAFSFVHLLDHLDGTGTSFALPPGSRVMETGGYKGRSRLLARSELHAQISTRLGIPPSRTITEYGMSELSAQAYNRVAAPLRTASDKGPSPAHSGTLSHPMREGRRQGILLFANRPGTLDESSSSMRHFRFPPWARAQVISPETGRQVAEGEVGLVRVFDLANVSAILAVQTEDLARQEADGFDLLGRAAEAEPRGCSLMVR